jgi:hypothetical protein
MSADEFELEPMAGGQENRIRENNRPQVNNQGSGVVVKGTLDLGAGSPDVGIPLHGLSD